MIKESKLSEACVYKEGSDLNALRIATRLLCISQHNWGGAKTSFLVAINQSL